MYSFGRNLVGQFLFILLSITVYQYFTLLNIRFDKSINLDKIVKQTNEHKNINFE